MGNEVKGDVYYVVTTYSFITRQNYNIFISKI